MFSGKTLAQLVPYGRDFIPLIILGVRKHAFCYYKEIRKGMFYSNMFT